MIQLAANLSFLFPEYPFLDRFAAAADAGFTAVEYLFPYDTDPDRIAAALSRHGLTQVLFNLPPGDRDKGERGLAALAGHEQDFAQSVDLALAYAHATDTKRLHLMAGIAAPDDPNARQVFAANIRRAAERVAPHGVTLMLEPLNGRDVPGYFLNDFGAAAALIAELRLPNLKLQFDFYHRQILQGDVVKGLEELMPLIGHVQVSSVPGRHEPGSGELDDIYVLKALDALGYRGFVGCEYHPRAGTLEGLGWIRRLG